MLLTEIQLRKIFTDGWFNRLEPFLTSSKFNEILEFVNSREKLGRTIYPAKKAIFRAFRMTPIEDLRVVWLGQDP